MDGFEQFLYKWTFPVFIVLAFIIFIAMIVKILTITNYK